MTRIGVIGPESTGKSTLCRTLAERYGWRWEQEYAREYVEQLDRAYTVSDLDRITEHLIGQLHAPYTDEVVLFDTEMIIMKVWYAHAYGPVPENVERALHDYPMDMYLLMAPDIAAEPDPVRENIDKREYFFRWYEREIQQTGVPYAVIRGEGEARIQAAIRELRVESLEFREVESESA